MIRPTFPRILTIAGLVLALALKLPAARAADAPTTASLQQVFATEIRPLLASYCAECHSGERIEAEVDLQVFETFDQVRQQPQIWLRVAEMLDTEQMPPKDAPQPSDEERAALRGWVRQFLTAEARAQAGDPGEVILRRLSNSEYTYTLRDLTGIDSLDPAREFPVDGAAGEGFTNTGGALVMSPALLTKYLDAGKEVASHATLLPDGIRFSAYNSRRDWTDEILSQIRDLYRKHSSGAGGDQVNLQGIVFETNEGGRLPIQEYLQATLSQRDALRRGTTSVEQVAKERGLSPRYLALLWQTLTRPPRADEDLVLGQLRTRWAEAGPDDLPELTEYITRWQQALWKFNTVGHIGRVGGPTSWMEAVSPVAAQQEFVLPLPKPVDGQDVVIYLAAHDAGDGNDHDYVVWKFPRLRGAGRPELALRDMAGLKARIDGLRQQALQQTEKYLAAAAEAEAESDPQELAARHGLDPRLMSAWLAYLDIAQPVAVEVKGHFTQQLLNGANYDFIDGWGLPETPSISANASDQEVRIPGIARPHSIVAHPSPTLFVAAGWQSPIDGVVQVEAQVVHAHPECGNGVQWLVQHRSGTKVAGLGQGEIGTAGQATMAPVKVAVRQGELISLVLGPRDGNHSCDLTQINLVITEQAGKPRSWDLAGDVSSDIVASNPHPDRLGHQGVWHFYHGPMEEVLQQSTAPVTVPADSVLAKWQQANDPQDRARLAGQIQALATGQAKASMGSPDAVLVEQLQRLASSHIDPANLQDLEIDSRFGKHPRGGAVDSTDLVTKAPSVIEIRIPAELADNRELVVVGALDEKHGSEGIVQLEVGTGSPPAPETLATLRADRPIVAAEPSTARQRVSQSLSAFRDLFPAALCYTKIVPVDEVVTLTLFYREDEPLKRLILDDAQAAELDRLWDELLYVAREPLAMVTVFEQLSEFATQDRPDLVVAFEPMRKPINERAEQFRQRLVETEPVHLAAVLDWAGQAWRRPLNDGERQELAALYQELRDSELSHDDAIRLTIARILTSPNFLYRVEQPPTSGQAAPVSDRELASRLSYFLWSSLPDEPLREAAEAGQLSEPGQLVAHTRRMLADARTRRLAIEFGCQWLHIRNFDREAEKNENLFPEFAELRGAMYEESVRFFEDMFRNDGSVLDLFNADHTFLNESLARLYGIEGVSGDAWQRVEGVRKYGRGGILGMATVLASQSGASRTSPILRGNWVYETLLGERLPRPPANVPQLPETLPSGLTERQLIEQHSSVEACAKCHKRIDPYGFALEQFDTVGRLRAEMVDTKTRLLDGKEIEGIDGLRDYLAVERQDDVLRQFSRKLLGYALGREVQLSDEPLLTEIREQLKAHDYRFSAAVEAIVLSPQFREKRVE